MKDVEVMGFVWVGMDGYGGSRVGVEDLGWVLRAWNGCGGPGIGVEGLGLVWRPGMGMEGCTECQGPGVDCVGPRMGVK